MGTFGQRRVFRLHLPNEGRWILGVLIDGFPCAGIVWIDKLEVGFVDPDGLYRVILFFHDFELFEVATIDDELVSNRLYILGVVGLFARAEVLSAWLYLLAVFKKFGEPAIDDGFWVFVVVVFLFDGELYVKVGVAWRFVGVSD